MMRRLALAFLPAALAIGCYYLWQLRATGDPLDFVRDQTGYYNYLGRAFAHGEAALPVMPSPRLLAQPNPWDPAVDESLKMHDMALFHGRYYLYHGPGPAVMLFTPWLLLTGHDLPERFALFLLCFGGFLFSCGVLLQWLAMADARPALPLLALMLLALGLCGSVPYLLNRVWVYEIAIGGGYFCVAAALYFLTLAVRRGGAWWPAVSGLLFGMAIACRPQLGLCGLIALAALAIHRRRWRPSLAFCAAFALAGAAVAAYNFQRFGNPLEFGVRYLLAGPDQNRIRPALANLLPGLYYWLACPPHLSGVFPWVRLAFRFPFGSPDALPHGYFMEATTGALFLAPFALAAAWVPRARDVRVLLWAAFASSAAVLLFLAAIGFTTQRYEVDFLPLAALVAMGNLAIHLQRSAGWKRFVLHGALVLSLCWGAVVGLALGIAGPYNDMQKQRPANYVRLAQWFSPIPRFRPLFSPAVRVAFTAEFTPQPDGFREPLLMIGGAWYRYVLMVEHFAGGVRFISMADKNPVVRELDRGPAAVEVTVESGKLRVTVNGSEIAAHQMGTLVVAPDEIVIGENGVDPGLCAPRFTGRITGLVRSINKP
jgi:hypothetical protein